MEKELEMVQTLYSSVVNFIVNYSFQILGALVILVVGFKLAGWLSRMMTRLCEQKNIDPTLSGFFGGVVKILVLVFVFILAVGKFGISIAPFIAALGALAFGSSFAIQGPLSNYGAGLSIILSRPFVIGNTILVKGVSGIVKEIRLAATILTTEDGEEITIPNKHIVGEILQNSFANRVVENVVGISYADDPQKAIDVIGVAIARFSEVAKDPVPQVGIQEFADSSINIGMRYWAPTANYHQTLYQVNLAVYRALAEASITIPYPRHDVHMLNTAG